MATEIRLIATDLDGTLIGSANELPLYATFRDKVNELRSRFGAVWVACTGRRLKSFLSFFTPMRMMGIMPEYIIIRHAYIFQLTRFGYLPHFAWNLHILYQLWRDRLYVNEAIDAWHGMVTGGSLGVTTTRRRRGRLSMRFDSEESAAVASNLLREKVKPYKHLKVFTYFTEVDIVTVPFTKGLALSELAGRLGVSPAHILAVGNGHNDISMLEGDVAGLTGCPANSEAEVMEAVHRSKGHIARQRSLKGVIEVLDAFESEEVGSELPTWWKDPTRSRMPPERGRKGPSQSKRKKIKMARVWLLAGCTYVVLLVFASFELIPLSGFVMKPYDWFVSLIQKAIYGP